MAVVEPNNYFDGKWFLNLNITQLLLSFFLFIFYWHDVRMNIRIEQLSIRRLVNFFEFFVVNFKPRLVYRVLCI
jgi:hypothetical protein